MVNFSGQSVTNIIPKEKSTALVQKLGGLVSLSEKEISFLKSLQRNTFSVEKGGEFIRDGETWDKTFILQKGWAIRYVILSSGRRQILGFVLPGDILGLHINFCRTASYSASALTPIQLAVVDPAGIMEICEKYPLLGAGLNWCTAREFAILGDHAVRLGRMSALERLAHLLLELWYRADLVGEIKGDWMALPMTQEDLADTLGLSLVHLNRTLRKMRHENLISLVKHHVRLNNIEKLMSMTEFNTSHLEEFSTS